MKRIAQSANAGFTLVELVIVIAIMMIFAGLLFPALVAARKASYGARCAANLHQISIACHEYCLQWNGMLPNNSYTVGDDPKLLDPPPPPSTTQAFYANSRGKFSTCNYEWFDAVAWCSGWSGKRSVAARYGANQADAFREETQYLWCPCIDQSSRDPGIFATSYGIGLTISTLFKSQVIPKPLGTDAYSYDFLRFTRVPFPSRTVFMTESQFWNFNADAYHLTNGSLGDLSMVGTVLRHPQIAHHGLNYLFFDGHVSRETTPPQSMGGEVGIFTTDDNSEYTITASEDTSQTKLLTSN